jgi:3-(3-hydroxy-phenyl)propionate hydroxylase
MSEDAEVDVLIVGAGPTGLATANYLGMNGLRVLVVERNSGTVDEPRAVSIDDESLRSLQTLGLDGQLTPRTLPGYGARYYSPGHKQFARVKPTTREFGHPRRSAFHQPELEAILLEGLKRYPTVEVRFEHQFDGFEQDDAGVTADITDPSGHKIKVRARYIAACDGGRSTIRKLLRIELVGSSFEERWLVLDCINDPDDTPDSIAYCDHRRPTITLPGPGRTRRWEFLLRRDEDADDLIQDSKIRELLSPFVGDREVEIIRKLVYTFHARIAEKWRTGRVFLLGDAAHLTPPYAGQGFNSGQRDAANFAWKAGAVVNGQAGPALLDTYEEERRDHAWSLIQMAIQIGWVMVPRNRLHTHGQIAFFKVAGLIPALRAYFIGMKFKPVPRFRNGFLAADGLSDRDTLVGRMLPQPEVIDGSGQTRKLDDVLGSGFALLAVDIDPGSAFVDLDQPLWNRLDANRVALISAPRTGQLDDQVTMVGTHDGELPNRFGPYKGKILLVRPDRYAAAAFTPDRASEVTDRLSELLV